MDRRPGVRNRGGKCQIRYYVNGVERAETLPIAYTKAGIASAAKIRKDKIDHIRYGIGEADGEAIPTFSQLAQLWLDTSELTPTARRAYKSRLNTHWLPYVGHKTIAHIKYVVHLLLVNVTSLLDKLKNRGDSP